MVSDAIIQGDLIAFKKCAVGRHDIDRRILEYRDLPYQRKYNPDERYVPLRGPTMTMLAILCEQDEILEYILENKCPDLSVRVEGTLLFMSPRWSKIIGHSSFCCDINGSKRTSTFRSIFRASRLSGETKRLHCISQ
jgi:hypothetical protein